MKGDSLIMSDSQVKTNSSKKEQYDKQVGQKIQTISGFVSVIGIAVSVIYGLLLVLAGVGINNTAGSLTGITGILVAVIGSAASWACGTILYGFGLLIDYARVIANSTSIASGNSQSEKEENM